MRMSTRPGHGPLRSEALEEGKLVVGSIPPGLSVERRDRIENPLLQFQVGVQIDLRRFDRLMLGGIRECQHHSFLS